MTWEPTPTGHMGLLDGDAKANAVALITVDGTAVHGAVYEHSREEPWATETMHAVWRSEVPGKVALMKAWAKEEMRRFE